MKDHFLFTTAKPEKDGHMLKQIIKRKKFYAYGFTTKLVDRKLHKNVAW
jgi:hypothetical protein